MLRQLLSPWTTARTWRALVHSTLDLLIGSFTFSVILTLLVLSAALLITFPLAIPFVTAWPLVGITPAIAYPIVFWVSLAATLWVGVQARRSTAVAT